MKKIIIGLFVIAIIFTSTLIYNHKQQPTKDNVLSVTNNWFPQTEEVYLVRKIDGEWLTIFRSQRSITIARLKQNWLGLWKIKNETGIEAPLASIYHPPGKNDKIVWSSSEDGGGTGIVYYFGQVINPKIQKIKIETTKNIYEYVPLIHTNGKRFFFKKVKGQLVIPVNIKGFSRSGKLLFSSIPY